MLFNNNIEKQNAWQNTINKKHNASTVNTAFTNLAAHELELSNLLEMLSGMHWVGVSGHCLAFTVYSCTIGLAISLE